MSYVEPAAVVDAMVALGAKKAHLRRGQLVLRGTLGGMFLGVATTLALTAATQTGLPFAGALVFPVGFVMVLLLGFEMVTGSFAVVPLAVLERRATATEMARAFWWVIVGHLLGGVLFGLLFAATASEMWTTPDAPVARALVDLAAHKTLDHQYLGAAGILLVVLKGVLCNWLVGTGVVMGLTSTRTGGKILAMWLPVMTFFALGLEHGVVNLFVVPGAMMLGAPIGLGDWWLWNQIPALVGNFLGALVFVALAMYAAHRRPAPEVAPVPAVSPRSRSVADA
ncbi:formate/nitrite transporter family protein [Georgenia thermotolerans]|uniref:Formate/nitrite transporter family protein n=1 Tax=Georgenia thermotolerans TaxID=527326 RepID=A0A7J5UV56_9MICO|nr:formate/nitrite transporter family protein [Georgenia thermotolerans]KAE8766158.1 formate/nitrite transporter family protein [Georgenia thermotolerans]